MLSALKNVLWENAEAIIPSYFPWLAPRYSAGPIHSQAPALLLNCGRSEKWPSRGSEWQQFCCGSHCIYKYVFYR